MFCNTSKITWLVKKIMDEHPALIKPNTAHEIVDPYIIAHAVSYRNNMQGLVPFIVTDENVSK